MRAVLQRVSRAKVTVGTEVAGAIGQGWLVLLGIAPTDTKKEVEWLADKMQPTAQTTASKRELVLA